jgi:hypothetical protein
MAELEEHLHGRRGKNRRVAFQQLRALDEKHAVHVVEEMVEAASGKNRAELGSFLVSTGEARFIERALKGRYGDLLVVEHAPAEALASTIDAFLDAIPTLPPEQAIKRARSLGLVPWDARARVAPLLGRALSALIDDERLPLELQRGAVTGLLHEEPALVWARRDHVDVVLPELAFVAGLRSGYAAPEALDDKTFLALVPPGARRAELLRIAGLPSTSYRLAPAARVRVLAALADERSIDASDRDLAMKTIAQLNTPEAVEAVLGRPHVSIEATALVCERLSEHEAHEVFAPLLKESERARDLACNRGLARWPAFLDDAILLLNHDPLGATAMLARSRHPRAHDELLHVFETCALDAHAAQLFAGVEAAVVTPEVRRAFADASLEQVVADAQGGRDRALTVDVLTVLAERMGSDRAHAALARLKKLSG